MRTNLSILPFVSILITAAPITGCALDGVDQDTESSEDDLAANRVQVTDIITTNETKTFAYTAQPRYRGFTFQAYPGDTLTLRGDAASGDLVRFHVLGKGFATLAYNSPTQGGALTYRFKQAGTFTLAVSTRDARPTAITFTAEVATTQRPLHDEPGATCDGDLTARGLAQVFAEKPKATGADWTRVGHYVPDAVRLGDYTRTKYVRTCDPRLGGCTAWAPVAAPVLGGNEGYLLVGVVDQEVRLALRSDEVASVASGVPGRPCLQNTAGFGYGARAGKPALDNMVIRGASSCSNTVGDGVVYATVMKDRCVRAVARTERRQDLGGGRVKATEEAIVFSSNF